MSWIIREWKSPGPRSSKWPFCQEHDLLPQEHIHVLNSQEIDRSCLFGLQTYGFCGEGPSCILRARLTSCGHNFQPRWLIWPIYRWPQTCAIHPSPNSTPRGPTKSNLSLIFTSSYTAMKSAIASSAATQSPHLDDFESVFPYQGDSWAEKQIPKEFQYTRASTRIFIIQKGQRTSYLPPLWEKSTSLRDGSYRRDVTTPLVLRENVTWHWSGPIR